ncbi:MAG TPA: HNH endonuclease, partial [Ilumatobacteraceae bacterium]|nr:HNH endonuclease [Ilumatobacteraceae bacterium]
GFTMSEASQLARVTARADQVPTLLADARRGRFSPGVLAMAARVASPQNQHVVAHITRTATPSQAARVFAKYRDCQSENGGAKPDPEVDFWAKHWTDGLGRDRIDIATDTTTGAMFWEAWQAARTAGEKHIDPTEGEQRRRLNAAEIARRMAQMVLDAANASGMSAPGDERFCVQVSVDLTTLARVLGVDFDPTLPVGLGAHAFIPATGRRLSDSDLAAVLCQSKLQLLLHHEGMPLWLGHEVRIASRQQRRALRFRAGVTGCEVPGCTQTRFVDAHHVRWYRHGGPTDLDNLVLLCNHHHVLVHEGTCAISIATDGDQRFTFWRGSRCLGTTVRGDTTGGRPPDIATLPTSMSCRAHRQTWAPTRHAASVAANPSALTGSASSSTTCSRPRPGRPRSPSGRAPGRRAARSST